MISAISFILTAAAVVSISIASVVITVCVFPTLSIDVASIVYVSSDNIPVSILHVFGIVLSSIFAFNVWTISPFESFITTLTDVASASTVPLIVGVSSLLCVKASIVILAATVSTSKVSLAVALGLFEPS